MLTELISIFEIFLVNLSFKIQINIKRIKIKIRYFILHVNFVHIDLN